MYVNAAAAGRAIASSLNRQTGGGPYKSATWLSWSLKVSSTGSFWRKNSRGQLSVVNCPRAYFNLIQACCQIHNMERVNVVARVRHPHSSEETQHPPRRTLLFSQRPSATLLPLAADGLASRLLRLKKSEKLIAGSVGNCRDAKQQVRFF